MEVKNHLRLYLNCWIFTSVNFLSGCPKDVPLPDISGSLSCFIPDYCTGIDCCVEIPQIRKAIHVYLLLDACSHRLKIGIENFGLDQAYFDFEFGKNLYFTMMLHFTCSMWSDCWSGKGFDQILKIHVNSKLAFCWTCSKFRLLMLAFLLL